ncbi:hypothetical protein [Streptomyces sp. NPDC051173]|uniref:hypothetical protein n=1 Tax=Streptomyces sp. NPDC051173 TaxID=3155164 RepID=UPI00344E097A
MDQPAVEALRDLAARATDHETADRLLDEAAHELTGRIIVRPDQNLAPLRFVLRRHLDVSGISGEGNVADGVLWPDGTASVRWRGEHPSIVFWDRGRASVEFVHGHVGATTVTFLDQTEQPDAGRLPAPDTVRTIPDTALTSTDTVGTAPDPVGGTLGQRERKAAIRGAICNAFGTPDHPVATRTETGEQAAPRHAPAQDDSALREAISILISRAARGVLNPVEGPLLRQHVEHLVRDRDQLAARVNTLEYVARKNRDHHHEAARVLERARTECDAMEQAMSAEAVDLPRIREHVTHLRAAFDSPGA